MIDDRLFNILMLCIGISLLLFRRQLALLYAKKRRLGQAHFLSQRYRANLRLFTGIGSLVTFFAGLTVIRLLVVTCRSILGVQQ